MLKTKPFDPFIVSATILDAQHLSVLFGYKKTKCMSFQLVSSSFDHPSIATTWGLQKMGHKKIDQLKL